MAMVTPACGLLVFGIELCSMWCVLWSMLSQESLCLDERLIRLCLGHDLGCVAGRHAFPA